MKKTENKTEELREQLASKKVNAFHRYPEKVRTAAYAFAEDYKDFLNASKTEREAVSYAVAAAEKAGFKPFEAGKKYRAGDKVYKINRGKALILAVIGAKGCREGVRIAAAHIDSPRLDLKPAPLYENSEMALFKTHYYGGIRKYQWVAIPLAMHGVVAKKDGTVVEIMVGETADDPVFTITDLLPHLAQEQSQKTLAAAFTGEDLNVTVGSEPVEDKDAKEAFKLRTLQLLNETYGITEDDFLSAEIEFVPAFRAQDVGFDRSLIGGYGHDDRVCAYPALRAVLEAKKPENTVITVLADKEEIGSEGNTGLVSKYLDYFVAELAEAEGIPARRVWAKSTCLSADVTAAYDPNYASAFEAGNACYVNHGVGVCKYTGARGKGGASDCSAEFVAAVRRVFDEADVAWQMGELGRVDLGGGGTVAKFVAALDADVLDVGVPVLSMHSPFEVIGKMDLYATYLGVAAFFKA
ncbi:MAG: aminopeptidase [Lachnospiraceae bacterium]|nr:aminopeptidase [Lachnospiraceae bacterium]